MGDFYGTGIEISAISNAGVFMGNFFKKKNVVDSKYIFGIE